MSLQGVHDILHCSEASHVEDFDLVTEDFQQDARDSVSSSDVPPEENGAMLNQHGTFAGTIAEASGELAEGFPSVKRPAPLDDNEVFNISTPFLVSERVDALAYHMSIAAPRWEESIDPPSVSMSNSTTHYVEKDEQCTAKPLHGPPPEFIQELLNITIDFSNGSPLMIAMKNSSHYFSFRAALTTKTMPNHPVPDKNENDYLGIVEASLHTLIPLVAVSLLQLWIHDGDSNDTQAFDTARDILIRLESSMVIRDKKCQPDHAAVGPETKNTSGAISHGSNRALATVDRKPKAFAEYNHQIRSFSNPTFTSQSKDGLVQEIIDDGRPFYKLRDVFIEGKNHNGSTPFLGGWRVGTLHLLAQMKVQCLRASSKMALFTALYAFNRVALVNDNQLYVSKNITSHLDKEKRQNPWANRPYLELLMAFLTAAIARAYPEAVPPKRRQRYSLLFTPDVAHRQEHVARLCVVYENDHSSM